MRRHHKKSRFGCKDCKQRHVKCDEARPACGNCVITRRQCSYLAVHGPAFASEPPFRRSRSLHTAGRPANLAPPTPASSTPSPRPVELLQDIPLAAPGLGTEPGLLGEGYNLMHLELLHHFDHELSRAVPLAQADVEPLLQLAVREAFTRPYLMDELLALSAAHKSALASNEHDASTYRTEATRLQTRAIARLNAAKATASWASEDDGDCVALFLFSALLGQHVLFDVFCPPRPDLAAVLDRFTHCLSLHRGIRAIAGAWWPRLQRESSLQFGPPPEHPGMGTPTSPSDERGTECAALSELLQSQTQLTESAGEACREAVDALQLMFDSARPASTATGAASSRRFSVVQEWPVRITAGYVELLEQRRPEALVILAYYSVLLHMARDHWAVGDAGSYLIQSITRHLGTYWAEWLRWPNEVLEGGAAPG